MFFVWDVLKMTMVITLLGGLSSGFGGLLGGLVHVKSKNWIAALYEVTAGIMTGIVCIDMLPESFEIASLWYSMVGVILGVGMVLALDYIIESKKRGTERMMQYGVSRKKQKPYTTMSLVVMLSMAMHNAIEGLAIGSGFTVSFSMGLSLLISIFLHDIPEGMVVGITNKTNQMGIRKTIVNSILVGLCVGIGCLIGAVVGNIEERYIALTLSIAAGAMLYIVSCDLIPMSKKLSNRKIVSIVYILGILIGAIITKL